MRRTVLGIDPGRQGGIAVLYPDGGVAAWPMPDDADLVELLGDLIRQADTGVAACLEQVGGYIGKAQPGSAMFRFGESFGFLRGVLLALEIPTELVRPQQWQRGLGGLKDLEGMARKRALKAHAARIFPSVKPTLATADALLIARYGLIQGGAA